MIDTVARWFYSAVHAPHDADARRIDWPRIVPFVAMHLSCLGVFVVGGSAAAIGVALALYALRMFAITAFYHRYLSHRAFRASRAMQFIFALLGASAVQRGPLWWVAQHRHHHAHSDDPHDAHSPAQQGFWWSHIGWLLAREHFATRLELTGERRYRAHLLAGLTDIQTHVDDVDDATLLEHSIVENLQRVDITPLEEAHAFQACLESVATVSVIRLRSHSASGSSSPGGSPTGCPS